jgi:hypothetical protein
MGRRLRKKKRPHWIHLTVAEGVVSGVTAAVVGAVLLLPHREKKG